MSDYSPPYGYTIPNMVSAFTYRLGYVDESLAATPPASTAWYSAGRTVYQYVLLPAPCVIRRVWWANGATTSGGATIEVGVYTDSGYAPAAKLVSGSATQGTASQVQYVDVTDTAISPGRYWLAITSDITASTTIFQSTISNTQVPAFAYEEATNPLPATATPVQRTLGYTWLYGFATTASP